MKEASFAIAQAIRKKNSKSSASSSKPSSEMVSKIMSKHMNCGGMAKYSKGGMVKDDEVESMDEAPEFYDPDFLSDEEQDHDINLTYPDPEDKEGTEGMGKRGMLDQIMARLRSKRSIS